MPNKITNEKLEGMLWDIRRYGAHHKDSAFDFITLLEGKPIFSYQQCIGCLLYIVQTLVFDKAEAEILLAAFGLLKGYEHIDSIEARREKYYRHSWQERKWSNLQSSSQKLENESMIRLAKKLLILIARDEWRAFIVDAPKKWELPTPSYLKENPTPFPFHNLPYVKNPHFTGREDKLKEICANFYDSKSPVRVQTISGMAGVGKTQLALEYAYQYYEDYENGLMWLNAETLETLSQTVFELLKQKGFPDNKLESRRAFLSWLENHNGWLLVYDNVEDYAILQSFMPKSDTGHILVTSRLGSAYRGGSLIEIPVFTEDAAASFLRRRTGLEDKEGAEKLAQRLGYFPLALGQAAAYIAETPDESFSSYLELLEQYGLSMLEDSTSTADYKLTVRASFEISFEKIQMGGAWQLMNICAFCAPDNIPLSWFIRHNAVLLAPLHADIVDRRTRNAIINKLVRYSLFRYGNGLLSVHRLLQEVIREVQDISPGSLEGVVSCFDLFCTGIMARSCSADNKMIIASVPHAFAAAEHFEKELLKDEINEANSMLLMVAEVYYEFSALALVFVNYQDIEIYLPKIQRAREIRENILGLKDDSTIASYFQEAMAYIELDDREKGLELLSIAEENTHLLLSTDLLDSVASVLIRRLARMYVVVAEYLLKNSDTDTDIEAALGLYKEALKIQTAMLGENHRNTKFTQMRVDLLEGRAIPDTEWKDLFNIYAEEMGLGPN